MTMQEKINRDAALVLLSGGQDSTTCLYWAKERFAEVTALTFDYGQTHRAETEAAEKIAALAGVEQHCADASFIATIGRSALTDQNIPMDETRPEGGYPNTFVPGRNMFFLGIAAVVARERGINHIVTGVSQTDFSGYPDCRDTFIKAMNVTLNEAMDYPFVGRPPRGAGYREERDTDVLQRHQGRRMRTLPGLPAAPCRAGGIPQTP